ncbi:MAG: hypothetical protein KME17_00335 [Cyanosarcina radialis HA8281-LM2]|jgi:hypothetical protein|nr:hypothetical protein [Cyanosarcina radialis HA8281-LM2]
MLCDRDRPIDPPELTPETLFFLDVCRCLVNREVEDIDLGLAAKIFSSIANSSLSPLGNLE